MTALDGALKIKIVTPKKNAGGRGRLSSRTQSANVRPFHMRISRNHGGGLWTIEDEDGQLYLAVLARPKHEHRLTVEANERHPTVDSLGDEYVYAADEAPTLPLSLDMGPRLGAA